MSAPAWLQRFRDAAWSRFRTVEREYLVVGHPPTPERAAIEADLTFMEHVISLSRGRDDRNEEAIVYEGDQLVPQEVRDAAEANRESASWRLAWPRKRPSSWNWPGPRRIASWVGPGPSASSGPC